MTMTAGRSVTMIPAKVNLVPLSTDEVKRRLRVAAYARVSTDTEDQLKSYEAQVEYYTEKIQANDEWEFAGVYTDEGTPYGQIPKSLWEGWNASAEAANLHVWFTQNKDICCYLAP